MKNDNNLKRTNIYGNNVDDDDHMNEDDYNDGENIKKSGT